MKDTQILVYGVDIDSKIYVNDMTDEQVIEEGEKNGQIHTLDSFLKKLNHDEINTENYFYRAVVVSDRTKYIRIIGENGTLILTIDEYNRGLDRENEGVVGEIINEYEYKGQ
jgi:4-hydroxyphenylpyruvate dioxygenase-like putative hemolysin